MIDRAETHDVPLMDLMNCADYLNWLYKFKKLPIEEIHFYVDRLTAIFNEMSERERTGY